MKTHLATLVIALASSGSLMSATETQRLRALCAEQEMQIRQLEKRIAQLTDSPPPSRPLPSAPTETCVIESCAEQSSTYTVISGDSMERIARKHGTTITTLAKLNGMKSTAIIHPGQKLRVPDKIAVSSAPSEPLKEARTHTVAAGETFYKISRKYDVPVDQLIALNPHVNHKALIIGEQINVDRAEFAVLKTPARSLAPAAPIPVLNSSASIQRRRASDRLIRIEKEITYSQFAANYNTTTRRLDELNGLELDPSTVLAQGSELYIPAQP